MPRQQSSTIGIEPFNETFGLPSSILNIAAWDHDMVLYWAEAVNLSSASIEKLADASGTVLNGRALEDAVLAEQVLGEILDGEDLETAVLELEALRILKKLQPSTLVTGEGRTDAAPTTKTDVNRLEHQVADTFAYLDGTNHHGEEEGYQSVTSSSTAFLAHAEAWFTKMHGDINAMYDSTKLPTTANPDYDASIGDANHSSGATTEGPRHVPSSGRTTATAWGDGWELPSAPGIPSEAAFHAAIRRKQESDGAGHQCDAMCSDDDDEVDDEAAAVLRPSTDVGREPSRESAEASANNSFSSVELCTSAVTKPAATVMRVHHQQQQQQQQQSNQMDTTAGRSYQYLVQPLGKEFREAPATKRESTSSTGASKASDGHDEFDF